LPQGPEAPATPADSNEAKIAAKYGMAMLGMFYADHRAAFVEGSRKFVKHFLKHKPGLFRNMPKFEHTIYEPNNAEISFALQDDGEYLLAVMQIRLTISGKVSGWLVFKRGGFSLSWPCSLVECKGTRQQIIDLSLLQLGDNPEDKDHTKVWQKVLSVVAPAQPARTYDEWIEWRLDNSRWKTEEQWLLDLMQSENPDLAAQAVTSAKTIASEDVQDVLRRIILDDRAKAFVRARAISKLTKDAGPEAMMALVDVADNSTPRYSRANYLYMNESYPFYDHPLVRWSREATDNWLEEEGNSITIGNKATEKLRELTKKDFGTDKKAWRKWIKASVK
jgi:hypothetical protein